MNIPFYSELTKLVELSPTEQIMYSYLLFKSISCIEYVFKVDYSIDMVVLKEAISKDEGLIGCYEQKQSVIAGTLNISEKSVWSSLKRLSKMGFIRNGYIYAPESIIIKGGYYPLLIDSGLKATLLIFYSFLKSRAELNGGWLVMSKTKMSSAMMITRCGITQLLNRLYRLGLAKRIGEKLYIR